MRRNQIVFIGVTALLAGCGGTGGDDVGPDGGVAPAWTNGVSTLAGSSDAGQRDGSRADARFNNPVNVALGPDGKLYVADFDNGRIRRVDADGNTETVVQKTGFARPFGLAFVGATLYVSTDDDDAGNHSLLSGTIWRVDTGSGAATVVVRGIGRPRGLAALPDGRLVMSDYMHHAVRVLDPRNAQIANLAGAWDVKGMVDGPGGAARFSTPYGAAVRADGSIVVADFDNNRIRVIAGDGAVTTLAGANAAAFADGALATARFNHPQAIAIGPGGDVYMTDAGNFRVRRIHAGNVETIAGSGTAGYKDDDDRLASQLYGLEGLSVRADGARVYVADGNRGELLPYNRVRVLKMD